MKTKKEIITWWKNTGFLKDLEEQSAETIALIFENCKNVINEENIHFKYNTETVIFPIIRRVFTMDNVIKNNKELINDLIIDTNKMKKFILYFDDEMVKQLSLKTEKYMTNLDWEAETITYLCDEYRKKFLK